MGTFLTGITFMSAIPLASSFPCPSPNGFFPYSRDFHKSSNSSRSSEDCYANWECNNCNGYWICINGAAVPMQCGSGMKFNPRSRACEFPDCKITNDTTITPDQCTTYMTLTDSKRLYTNKEHRYGCDRVGDKDQNPDWRGPGWYRYVGGENRMALKHEVTQTWQCGTGAAGYLDDLQSIPDVVGQTKNATVRFYAWDDSHDRHIKITNCGTFHVYQLPDTKSKVSWEGYCFA